jgi:hypothetical protein
MTEENLCTWSLRPQVDEMGSVRSHARPGSPGFMCARYFARNALYPARKHADPDAEYFKHIERVAPMGKAAPLIDSYPVLGPEFKDVMGRTIEAPGGLETPHDYMARSVAPGINDIGEVDVIAVCDHDHPTA